MMESWRSWIPAATFAVLLLTFSLGYTEFKHTGIRITSSEGDRPTIKSPWDVSTVSTVKVA